MITHAEKCAPARIKMGPYPTTASFSVLVFPHHRTENTIDHTAHFGNILDIAARLACLSGSKILKDGSWDQRLYRNDGAKKVGLAGWAAEKKPEKPGEAPRHQSM